MTYINNKSFVNMITFYAHGNRHRGYNNMTMLIELAGERASIKIWVITPRDWHAYNHDDSCFSILSNISKYGSTQ